MFVRLRNNRYQIFPGNQCALEYSLGDFLKQNPDTTSLEIAIELEKHMREVFPYTFITDLISSNFKLQDAILSQTNHTFDVWSYIIVSHKNPMLLIMGFSSEEDMIMGRLII